MKIDQETSVIPTTSRFAAGLVGFRAGIKGARIDDVVIQPITGPSFRQNFRNSKNWPRTFACNVGILLLFGALFSRISLGKFWVAMTYTVKGTKEQINYRLNLATTKPLYGGLRWWMVCPLSINGKPCKRRTRRLYLPPGGKYFGCRQCYSLTYTSCQESHKFDSAFNEMAKSFPGTTGKEIRKLLDSRGAK